MNADDYMTYEEFGRKFFEVAVTEERVRNAIAAIAGDEFEMGPMGQGPGKIAKVTAKVRIHGPARDAASRRDDHLRHPDPARDRHGRRPAHRQAEVHGVRRDCAAATARAAEPLLLILDVEKPRSSDISIHVTSKSLRGEVVRIIGGIDAEIRRFIAAHVSGEIDSPASQKAKIIDVADSIDAAWTGV